MLAVFTKKKLALRLLAFALGTIYLGNASWLRKQPEKKATLLAHRGVHQTFPVANIDSDTCTAQIIHEPTHRFIENTEESIEAAFDLGASIVEIDIRATLDGRFAVFHDEDLACRTNGNGPIHKHTLEHLQTLDVGYGYTPDSGKTYPFRGLYHANIPSLLGILNQHQGKKFLIHLKSESLREAELLKTILTRMDEKHRANLMLYGPDNSVGKVLTETPNLKGYTRSSVKRCLISYELIGWTGVMPAACRDTILQIPVNYASYLWGWPRAFMSRMNAAGTQVIITGPRKNYSGGIDDLSSFNQLHSEFKGIIWTNKIELVGLHNSGL